MTRSRALLIASLLAASPSAAPQDPAPLCLELLDRLAPTGTAGDDGFGASVALSGDNLVVGAPWARPISSFTTNGRAYAFRRQPDGSWLQEAVLEPPVPANAQLGKALDLDGDLAVIGGNNVALVYERVGGAWSGPVTLSSPSVESGSLFGAAVAVHGERILVGAQYDDDLGVKSGSATVFERLGGAWIETAKLHGDDTASPHQFGAAVALSGERALIGAWGADGTTPGQGAAYVFARDAAGGWTQEQKLLSGSPAFITFFGWTVALDEEHAVVGNGRPYAEAAAYVFGREGGRWEREARFAEPAVCFGTRVALEGDALAVGAPDDGAGGVESGSVFLYAERDGSWELQTSTTGPLVRSFAGTGLAFDQGALVIGAPGTDAGTPPGSVELHALRTLELASATFRNGGANPASYAAVSASIGGSLELTVFPAATGHTHALVIGFDGPALLTLAGGQTLLCLDQGGNGELVNTGFAPGPIASFELPVPADARLVGLRLCTQAVHAFGAGPFALSNAQDLVIGGCRAR